METRTPVSRKRSKKPKIENYYKVLGVRANATAESIKKSYIQLVKQFPPEQHPESFQQIRRAYEILRDPDKRREYDFQRKYGGSLEKLMDEAYEWLEEERYDKADPLLRKAITLAPSASAPRIALIHSLLIQDEYEQVEREEEQLLRQASESLDGGADTENGHERMLYAMVRLLVDSDYPEEALVRLERLQREYPDKASRYSPLLSNIYRSLGREEEAFLLIEQRIPAISEQRPEHAPLFFDWVHVMMHLGKWQYWSRVQPRIKKFLRSIKDEEDRLVILNDLLAYAEEYNTAAMFRQACLFADLAVYLDPGSERAGKLRQQLQQTHRLWETDG